MKKLAFVLLSIITLSCGGNAVEKPKHLLSEDEMANIIYDITMLQALRSSQPVLMDYNNVKPKEYIYKKYKIDSLTFAQNNAWYAADMEHYETIQKRAADRIKKERDSYTAKKDTAKVIKPKTTADIAKARRDSLKQVASDKAKLRETQK